MFWAAFITGLIGSLHCTGMCGPLICAMPINKDSAGKEISGLIIYNAGRIISYALLGLLIGSGGAIISKIAGIWFAYFSGVFLITLGLYKLIWGKSTELKMPPFMRRWMGRLFKTRSPLTLPILGMLNGIIPCGAVYAALAGATVMADPWNGALYMIIFGLATWPAIFSSYYLSSRFIKYLRGYYRPATAILLCVLGSLLIVRAAYKPVDNNKHGTEIICK
jgi:uncharacterized protein